MYGFVGGFGRKNDSVLQIMSGFMYIKAALNSGLFLSHCEN